MTDTDPAAAPATRGPDDRDERMSRPQRRAGIVAALLLFAAGVFTVHEFLPALAWAVIFAIGVWPVFDRLARRYPRHRRGLLPAGVIAAIVLVFVIPLAMLAVPVAQDAQEGARYLEQAREEGLPAPAMLSRLPFGSRLVPLWERELGQPGGVSKLAGHAMSGNALAAGRAVGGQVVHRLVLLGFMLLALYFLLRDADAVAEQCRIAARRAFGQAGEDIGRQMIRSVHGTVDGLVLVGLGEGVLLGIAYLIAGVPHPALFGLMTALLAMVPFGAAVAFLIAAAILAATGKIVAAVAIVVAGFVVTFVADHFIRPVLIGGATRLPFLWVLLGILGGVGAWGLVGLFVGPAIMAALILLWREWVGAERGPINPAPDEVRDHAPALRA